MTIVPPVVLLTISLAAPVAHAEDPDEDRVPMDLDMRVHGYGDIGLDLKTSHHPLGFDMGDAVVAYGATLDEWLQMDLDVVLGLDQHGDWLAFVDRMVVEIEVSDALRITGGKFYLPVGYWNPEIPYGSYLYPTQFRPAMLQFERHGAPLPVHQAGVDLDGDALLGYWTLGYHLGFGNGRSPHLTETQDIGDAGLAKATWARLTLESPSKIEVGVSGYYDPRIDTGHRAMDLSEDFGEQGDVSMEAHTHEDEVVLEDDVRELIGAVHLAWNGPRAQLLAEAMLVGHQLLADPDDLDPAQDGPLVTNLDGYVQYAHKTGRLLTLYGRLDYLELWHEDPLYQDLGKLRIQGIGTLGTRWELGLRAALKVEASVQRDVIFPAPGLGLRVRERLGAGVYLAAGF